MVVAIKRTSLSASLIRPSTGTIRKTTYGKISVSITCIKSRGIVSHDSTIPLYPASTATYGKLFQWHPVGNGGREHWLSLEEPFQLA